MNRTIIFAAALVTILAAGCGSSNSGKPSAASEATTSTTASPSASTSTTTARAETPPAWTKSKSLPGATIKRGATFEGIALWVDTTNHVVYADNCGRAERATKAGGPYAPAPDSTGTVIAYGWTCPTA